MIRARAFKPVLLFALACAAALPALAQWQWIDNNGRRVFSDQTPPPDIPDKNILRRPGGAPRPASAPAGDAAAAPAATTPAPAAAAATAASGARTAGAREKELEDRKKQAEAADAAKKKAEEERIARLREQNCTLARQAKATLDSGIRLARVNDKGEREIMDDSARAAEGRRIDEVIANDCKAG